MNKSKIEHLDKQEYTHLPHAEQDFENHEQSDVAIRPLVWTLGVLVAVVAVTYVGMAGVFTLFDKMAQDSSDNPQLSNVNSGVRKVPQGMPELQGVPAPEANPNSPAQDMVLFKNRNIEVLAGRAPMRPGLKPGMPIQQAIDEAMSQKIFKTRPTTAPAGSETSEHPDGATNVPTGDAAGENPGTEKRALTGDAGQAK